MNRDSIELMGTALAPAGLDLYEIRLETRPGAASGGLNSAVGRQNFENQIAADVAVRPAAGAGHMVAS